MSWVDNFLISLFAKKVGEDKFGNRYFETKKQGYLNRAKRYVIYKGQTEASKVPPMWHAWLHHTIDTLPKEEHEFAWQEDFTPNLTGTKLTRSVQKKYEVALGYDKWQPLRSEVKK